MNAEQQDSFYRELLTHHSSLSELLADENHFADVPADWHVVVTDIKGSTELVAAGHHEEINLIATGSIIAALNIAHGRDIELPFFFGGDGATLLVPDSLVHAVLVALQEHSANTQQNYSMTLRVGSLPVGEANEKGHPIRIAKLFRNNAFSIPIVTSDGLLWAEKKIKERDLPVDSERNEFAKELDLSGMECRWDRIKPPQRSGEVVCLLVTIQQQGNSTSILKTVIDHIDSIYGPRVERNPITKEQLHLDSSPSALSKETRVKLGRFDWRYAAEHWLRTAIIGPAFMRFAANGQRYVASVPELSDTLTIDGRVNTVISGTQDQRDALVRELKAMEDDGLILFGLHASPASIMSCYVRNREDQHIHFIDGADGGYTLAATMLKPKIRHVSDEQ